MVKRAWWRGRDGGEGGSGPRRRGPERPPERDTYDAALRLRRSRASLGTTSDAREQPRTRLRRAPQCLDCAGCCAYCGMCMWRSCYLTYVNAWA
mmetsp:Transcript_23340/g.39856  ORF Transcript_23340/g.39856 Transcript_23340/m.39856 type:complete len:94 (-) Transcript_23340:198-479(-)